MNAVAEQPTPDLQTQLAAAYTRRTAARSAHEQAAAATARGRSSAQAAQAEYQRRLDEKQAFKQRHSERTRQWIADGHSGAPPQLVLDPATESKLLNAEVTAESALAALAALESAERKTQGALTAAEAVVVTLVDQLLSTDYGTLIDDGYRHLAALVEIDKKLRARADDLHVPINEMRGAFSASDRASRLMDVARSIRMYDELNTPLPLLTGMARDNQAEVDALAERRRRLIAGEPTEGATNP